MTCDSKYDKTCEIVEHLDIKYCSPKKRLFDKIVFACADEILNTTDATLMKLPMIHKLLIKRISVL